VTLYDDPNRECVGLSPIWGGADRDNVPQASGATAGIPGTWTPAGTDPPANLAAMSGVTASPSSAWTTGQYMQTALTGAPGRVTWTGSAWVGGVAP